MVPMLQKKGPKRPKIKILKSGNVLGHLEVLHTEFHDHMISNFGDIKQSEKRGPCLKKGP